MHSNSVLSPVDTHKEEYLYKQSATVLFAFIIEHLLYIHRTHIPLVQGGQTIRSVFDAAGDPQAPLSSKPTRSVASTHPPSPARSSALDRKRHVPPAFAVGLRL